MDEFDDDTLTSEEIDKLIGADELLLFSDDKIESLSKRPQGVLNDIVSWGDSRKISQQLHDTNGFISNIVEELSELKEATAKGDWEGQVDAIADIMVFCTTELPKLKIHPEYALQECLTEIGSRTGVWNEDLQKWKKFTTAEARAKWVTADYKQHKGQL